MADDLMRSIPRLDPGFIAPKSLPGNIEDTSTEGDERLDVGGPPAITLGNPEGSITLKQLQDTPEFRAYRSYSDDFSGFLAGKVSLRYFRAHEFLAMGGSHGTPGASCFGRNALPPRELWDNAINLTRVLDELRHRLGAAITLNSVYRNEAYNTCLQGTAAHSRHMRFDAADFVCHDSRRPRDWHRVAKDLRSEGFFKGGIGLYNSFVHVDTRGNNADW